jgi:hypothetical protein
MSKMAAFLLLGGCACIGLLIYVNAYQKRSDEQWHARIATESAHQTERPREGHTLEWETTKRTPTLYLYLPSSGSFVGYWEQPLNKNFELIDAAYRQELDRLRKIESRVSAIDGKAITIVQISPLPPLSENPSAEQMNAKLRHVDDCYQQQMDIAKELARHLSTIEQAVRNKPRRAAN